jgi:hypothetical protein
MGIDALGPGSSGFTNSEIDVPQGTAQIGFDFLALATLGAKLA